MPLNGEKNSDWDSANAKTFMAFENPIKVEALNLVLDDEFISNGNENPVNGVDNLMTIDEYSFGSMVDPLDMSEHPLVIDENPIEQDDDALSVENPRNECGNPGAEEQFKAGLSDIDI